jgi:uncharacterized protein YabN with tetrapyrrole methylase and pyrophosphatase domain
MIQASPTFREPRLYVIGVGVTIPDHITVEAFRAMAACNRIYTLLQEPPHVWLPPNTINLIPVINVFEMYVEGALRTSNYDRVADSIFNALNENAKIGYVTYGNPLVYDSVAQNLIRNAQQNGVAFQIVAGISSIDTLLCDLGVDMAPGLQVYEASWLVAGQIQLDATVPAILVQIGTFGSFQAHYRTAPPASALSDLVAYLRTWYPASHAVFLVRSANSGKGPANIRKICLGDLGEAPAKDVLGASMYVPAAEQARLSDGMIARMERR